MNGLPLPRDSEERKNFDRQETFILGDPAASFDRPCGHSYERKYDNPHEGSQCRSRYLPLSSVPVDTFKTMTLFTVRDTIVVRAGGRHCCIGLGGVGFVPSNEDLAFREAFAT